MVVVEALAEGDSAGRAGAGRGRAPNAAGRTPPPPKPLRSHSEAPADAALTPPPSAPDVPTVPAPPRVAAATLPDVPDAVVRSVPEEGPAAGDPLLGDTKAHERPAALVRSAEPAPAPTALGAALARRPVAGRAGVSRGLGAGSAVSGRPLMPPKPTRAQASPQKSIAPALDAARSIAPPAHRAAELRAAVTPTSSSGEYLAARPDESAASRVDGQGLPGEGSGSLPAEAPVSLLPVSADALAETVRPAPPAGGRFQPAGGSEEATAAGRRSSVSSDSTALQGRGAVLGAATTPLRETGSFPGAGSRTGVRGPASPERNSLDSGRLQAYREQSALVRILAPFIEDPRPQWQLFLYFLFGLGLGFLAAYALSR